MSMRKRLMCPCPRPQVTDVTGTKTQVGRELESPHMPYGRWSGCNLRTGVGVCAAERKRDGVRLSIGMNEEERIVNQYVESNGELGV